VRLIKLARESAAAGHRRLDAALSSAEVKTFCGLADRVIARRRAGRVGRMIVAFSISPAAGDDAGGVSEAVAEAVRVVRASGLPNETNAMFTNIEGEWDEVMAVVKEAVEAVAAVSPRVSLVLKADIRPGYTGQLTAKVERIEQALSD
jgi:uncharacterized protein (TIGR00106 family)